MKYRKYDILTEQSTNKTVIVQEPNQSSMVLVKEGKTGLLKRTHVSDLDFLPSAIISSFQELWNRNKLYV